MPNTSASGGYLVPDGAITPPLEDDALDNFLHDFFQGVAGFTDPTLVRPRWQPETPDMPDRNTDWFAFGVMKRPGDPYPAIMHGDTLNGGQGADVLTRNEMLEVLLSFYGPNCQAIAALVRDGLMIGQNMEVLFLAGMALVEAKDLTKNPEIVKNVWLQRVDLPMIIRREVRREYPVLNLVSAQATLIAPAAPDHAIDTSEGPRP